MIQSISDDIKTVISTVKDQAGTFKSLFSLSLPLARVGVSPPAILFRTSHTCSSNRSSMPWKSLFSCSSACYCSLPAVSAANEKDSELDSLAAKFQGIVSEVFTMASPNLVLYMKGVTNAENGGAHRCSGGSNESATS